MALAAPSLPSVAPHTHGDDLGIKLGRQAGHAGLGAEQAVEGLHGARCHQLQRTWCQELGGSALHPLSPYPKGGSAPASPALL